MFSESLERFSHEWLCYWKSKTRHGFFYGFSLLLFVITDFTLKIRWFLWLYTYDYFYLDMHVRLVKNKLVNSTGKSFKRFVDQECYIFRALLLRKVKHIGRFSNLLQSIFKDYKGKDVRWEFPSGNAPFFGSFQKLNFSHCYYLLQKLQIFWF